VKWGEPAALRSTFTLPARIQFSIVVSGRVVACVEPSRQS